ncbi:MFS transporter [Oenococcus oeni]|uniref:MFS transporter n=1 Tax=Oenococcus oeni TaxID=1247 RepID=UPI001EF9FC5C|nr:MFS transporter [Oenococcus oeni]
MHKVSSAFVYFFGALGGLLFGYDTGVISGAILFIEKQLHLDSWQQGWVVSAVLLGAILGAAVIGPMSDRFGRRKLVLLSAIIFFIGALGSAFSPEFWTLILSRIILGMAVGAASALIPTYLAELIESLKYQELRIPFLEIQGPTISTVGHYNAIDWVKDTEQSSPYWQVYQQINLALVSPKTKQIFLALFSHIMDNGYLDDEWITVKKQFDLSNEEIEKSRIPILARKMLLEMCKDRRILNETDHSCISWQTS